MKRLSALFAPERPSIVAGFSIAFILLATGIGLAIYDNQLYREQALKEITLQTQILAASEAASLDFDDPKATQQYLDALQVNPRIDQAAVYDRNGRPVARFMHSGAPEVPKAPPVPGYSFDRDTLSVIAPVLHGDRNIGTVYIKADIEPVTRRLPRYGAIVMLSAMAALVVAVLLMARARLAAANAKLLVEMEERSKAEEALRQSQKMEVIGQLTGGIAHDFNNMLAVIMGNLSTLQRRMAQGQTERIGQFAQNAMDGARRAATLTQQLLAFSRRQPLAPVAIDVPGLIFDMSELLGHTLGEHINLETINSPGTWQIFADQSQLETAIINLAVNARDAMPNGGTLTIKTANVRLQATPPVGADAAQPGDYVVITVKDTGDGMSPEIMAKAFEPFFTTKSVGKGTGLGLSQVYGFVNQSSGHVNIDSEVGGGTIVRLYLPRLVGARETSLKSHVSRLPASGRPEEIILVVEDETQVRHTTVASLRDLGYTVRHAEGVKTALNILEAQPNISLLFTDVVMPDGNGEMLADEVKRRWPDLKVLFTTGYIKDSFVHEGVADHGVQLLMKPFTFEQLASKVREVLEKY